MSRSSDDILREVEEEWLKSEQTDFSSANQGKRYASDASSGSYIAGHGAQNGGENESPPSEEEDDVSFSDYDDSLDEPQGPEYDDPTGVKFRRRQAAVRYRRLEADEIKKENEDLRAQSEHEKALAARREVRLKKVAAQEDLSGSTNVTSNADANSDNGAVDRPDIVAGLNEVTVSKSVTESEEGSSMPTTEKEEKGGMEVVDEESDSPSDDQEDLSPFVSLRNFSAAQAQKDVGNTLYSKGKWMEAIAAYSKAIELCPWSSDKDKERAIYYGNRAACYMAMAAEVERKEQGANANASANKSDTQHNAGSDPSKHGSGALQSLAELGSVFSNVSGYRCPTACVSLYEQCLYDCDVALSLNPEYVKVISRRASTLEKLGQLQDAKADYEKVLSLDKNNRMAKSEHARIEKLCTQQEEKLKDEMLDKLKGLGNSVLGYFGLSLDNFKAQKDPNTGSYSISFQQ